MSQTTKITIAVIITAIVVGSGVYFWQNSPQRNPEVVTQPTEKTYSGDSFTVQYPSSYQVSKDNIGIVTISGSRGKIMIGDFSPDAGPAPTLDMTQEQLDELPKNIQSHGYEGKIASALFYKTGDNTAKKELEVIQASIELK